MKHSLSIQKQKMNNFPTLQNHIASCEDWTHDPWFTRPVLYHWAKEALLTRCQISNFFKHATLDVNKLFVYHLIFFDNLSLPDDNSALKHFVTEITIVFCCQLWRGCVASICWFCKQGILCNQSEATIFLSQSQSSVADSQTWKQRCRWIECQTSKTMLGILHFGS